MGNILAYIQNTTSRVEEENKALDRLGQTLDLSIITLKTCAIRENTMKIRDLICNDGSRDEAERLFLETQKTISDVKTSFYLTIGEYENIHELSENEMLTLLQLSSKESIPKETLIDLTYTLLSIAQKDVDIAQNIIKRSKNI